MSFSASMFTDLLFIQNLFIILLYLEVVSDIK